MIGRRLGEIYPDWPEIAEDFALAFGEHRTVNRELNFRLAPDGEIRQLDVSYVFVPPDQVMVHADDITELRENEERLRAVIATLEAGLLTDRPPRPGHRRQPGGVRDLRPLPRASAERSRLVAVARAALRGRQPALRSRRPRTTLFGGEEAHDVTVLLTQPTGEVVTVKASHRRLRSGPAGGPPAS